MGQLLYHCLNLFVNGGNNFSRSAIVAKLAEVDALPSAEVEAPFGDGDGKAHTEERTLGMRGHIVETLERMFVIRFALSHQAVHNPAHVCAYIRVGILVNGECARSVLHKEIEQSHFGKLPWQMLHHLTRNEVTTATLGGELKGGLLNHKMGRRWRFRICYESTKLLPHLQISGADFNLHNSHITGGKNS